MTDWSPISPLLNNATLSSYLPTVPTVIQASSIYPPEFEFSNGAPFATFSLKDFPNTALLCPESSSLSSTEIFSTDTFDDGFAAARAGPSDVCDPSTCGGLPQNSVQCRADINGESILLKGKLGTYWSKALGTPAWAQFTFPAVMEGSEEVHFRFELDGRYRPELYGGNACASASADYECVLCRDYEVWDKNVPQGVHVLWTAAGREDFVIDGPFELGEAWDEGDLVRTLDVPEGMAFEVGDYPVVTLMTFSQYPAYGEVSDPSSCSVNFSNQGNHTYKDKPLMISEVSLMYRSNLNLLKTPPASHPRLYGTDAEWMAEHVTPFITANCDPDTSANVGWFEDKGYWSVKTHFDYAARGYDSCSGQSGWDDIGDWSYLEDYFKEVGEDGSLGYPRAVGGFRAFHLLRRSWACHDGTANDGVDGVGCEYNTTETDRLATAIVEREMIRFRATVWSCGTICGGNGNDAAFDLTTAEQVGFFVHLYDVFVSRPNLLSPSDIAAIDDVMEAQIDIFIATFWNGGWQLWNGNNWTPHLCTAAIEWAVTFWHEKQTKALEVLRIASDIMWLHRDYYTDDGVYVEGLAVYTYMSMEGTMAMASLTRAGFGFAPSAIDVDTLQKAASYMISSITTDGYTVEFGDSHRKRGFDSQSAVLEAVLADLAVNGGSLDSTAVPVIDAVQARAFAAALYGSGGVYNNPWRVRGHILQFDNIPGLRDPPQYASQPLGGERIDLFPEGGYARLMVPLLGAVEGELFCFGGEDTEYDDDNDNELCIDKALPSLADNIPYSSISLQARNNIYAHSEVDFGTFLWSAWGTRLISEFGYGTISTSVSQWDMRRYAYLDNNPAGHNTVIVREAFPGDSTTMNFSQLNFISGSISEISPIVDSNNPVRCILSDGSTSYGSTRSDGWLSIMKRHVCQFTDGTNLLLDVLQVKPDREPMSLYGSQYGGPDFDEGPVANQRLTLDEYFYTDTGADVEVINGIAQEILPYDRDGVNRCTHVDVEVGDGGKSVVLNPVCGIGKYRRGDGKGKIVGMSVIGNGSFMYDGLVTSVDRWLTPHTLRKRRFRFISDDKVGPEGDVRAFVLAPYPASQPATNVHLTDCALILGCTDGTTGAVEPIVCSCVQACVGEVTSWIVVLDGTLTLVRKVGTCDGSSINLDTEIIVDIRTQLGFTTDQPTQMATTRDPSPLPTRDPTQAEVPTKHPTDNPTTKFSTEEPTKDPTIKPTKDPTQQPTKSPTHSPTSEPSTHLTQSPSIISTLPPTFAPSINCSKNKFLFRLDLQTDDNGTDTRWILKMKKKKAKKYKKIDNGKGYDDNTLYKEEICIRKKRCYLFVIRDSRGDGLCCSHGQGYYRITVRGKVKKYSIYDNTDPQEITKFGVGIKKC